MSDLLTSADDWVCRAFGVDPRNSTPADGSDQPQAQEEAPPAADPAPPQTSQAPGPLDEPQQCEDPGPQAQADEPPAADPPAAPDPPPAAPSGPAYVPADQLYRMGYNVGLRGGFPICPAGGDADGEAAYNSGYAAGKKDAYDRQNPPAPTADATPPGQELTHRMITVLSDDGVGTVQKEFTGTNDQLDQIEAEALRQIQQHWLNNLPGEDPK